MHLPPRTCSLLILTAVIAGGLAHAAGPDPEPRKFSALTTVPAQVTFTVTDRDAVCPSADSVATWVVRGVQNGNPFVVCGRNDAAAQFFFPFCDGSNPSTCAFSFTGADTTGFHLTECDLGNAARDFQLRAAWLAEEKAFPKEIGEAILGAPERAVVVGGTCEQKAADGGVVGCNAFCTFSCNGTTCDAPLSGQACQQDQDCALGACQPDELSIASSSLNDADPKKGSRVEYAVTLGLSPDLACGTGTPCGGVIDLGAAAVRQGAACDLVQCGDGFLDTDTGEECDDGPLNGTAQSACSTECKHLTAVSACANPTVIPAAGGTFTGETGQPSTLEGTCGFTGRAGEQVFQWTPDRSGVATIETCSALATTFDTVLYLRQGTCDGGSEVACDDDAYRCGTTTDRTDPHRGSRLTPTVTAGQTYFIVVDGYNGGAGAFDLSVTPPGEACDEPTTIPPEGGTFRGETSAARASTETGTCGLTGSASERVFAWTPAQSGVATIETCSALLTGYDTVLYLRSGTCADGAEVACNDDTAGCGTTTDPAGPHRGSRLTPTVSAGQTYFIVVDGYNGRTGDFALTVIPPGSACDSASAIPPEGGIFAGTTKIGRNGTLAGSCGSSDAASERVFRWTPAVSGVATIETCSATATTYDTVLYVREATCADGAELACNDDTAGCGTTTDPSDPHRGSRVTPTVSAGQTYFIVVDGYGGRDGDFALTVTPPNAGGG